MAPDCLGLAKNVLDWGLIVGLLTFLKAQAKKFVKLNFRPGGGPLGFVVLDRTELAVDISELVNFYWIGSKWEQIGWSVNNCQFIHIGHQLVIFINP